ncbi:MAG TPA: crotonase/enoyl-CoA hydratase family protein [Candidatus Binatus sp.]|nr:crotonase/enoyl-CoA hydratase family protein [Candidatus Binatus sp.]
MPSDAALLYEKSGGIATLTMNRPAVRNALNAEMLCRLADAWQDVNDDPAVRVAILTGAGEDAFCAGADLDRLVRMMQGLRPPETEFDQRIVADYQLIYKGLLRSYDVVKPVVAAVKGFCVAGGTEILQTTDIRVAAEDARFAIAEVKWSLFPMGGSTARLPRQIPYCNAMEILLTGEQFSAAEALRFGLVNKVVPAAQVMAEARRYAEVICGNGPLAVQAVKRSVLAGLGRPTAEALEKEMEIGIPVSMSEDAREGTKAFKEKRKPVFTGR